MAHIAKATRGQVGGLVAHDERSCENHTNEKIRVEDSHLNFNYIEEPGMTRYNNIIENSYVLNRKDVNTLAMVSVTIPKDVKNGDENTFFMGVHQHLSNYFGADSVVSSIVHRDETTPHLHFKAVPRYWNEKKERYQVSFDKVCPRSFYQNLHKDLSKELEGILGYKVSIENGATIDGNKTIKELKQKQYDEIAQLERQKEEIQAKIDDLKKTDLDMAEIEKIQPKPFLGAIKGVSVDDVEDLKLLAKQKYVLERENKALKNENIKLKQQVPTVEQKLENSRKFAKLANLEKLVDRIPKEQLEKLNQKSNSKNNER